MAVLDTSVLVPAWSRIVLQQLAVGTGARYTPVWSEWIIAETWPGLRDENDVPVWQTAVLARAEYVVSQNLADFPSTVQGRHVYEGIEYLTDTEFVQDVLGEDPVTILGAQLPRDAALRSRRTP